MAVLWLLAAALGSLVFGALAGMLFALRDAGTHPGRFSHDWRFLGAWCALFVAVTAASVLACGRARRERGHKRRLAPFDLGALALVPATLLGWGLRR